MAGVYIKGIEMPGNAEGCETIIRIQPNGEALDLHGFHIGATAIHVPEHGRLIDADALYNHFMDLANDDWNKSTGSSWADGFIEAALDVEDAPTIIPADKENDNDRLHRAVV